MSSRRAGEVDELRRRARARATPRSRSFSQYSTALTSWLVVRSIALTRAASATENDATTASSVARAASRERRDFGDRGLRRQAPAARRPRRARAARISANSLKLLAQRVDLRRVAAVERRQRGQAGVFGGVHGVLRRAIESSMRCYNARPLHMHFPPRVFRAETDRLHDESLRPQGARRARGEEDRVPDGRGSRRGMPGNPVHAYNPLGKLPVLILDDGTHLYDSRVIVEYIDLVSPVSRLIPEPARQRIAVKKWEALADGVCDAAAAIVVERRRPSAAAKRRMDRAPAAQDRRRRRRTVARARRARVVPRRELFAGGHRDRLRARLSRPAPRRARLARAVPEPRAPRRQARQARVVRRNAPRRRSIPATRASAIRVTAPASAARGSPGSRASKCPA